MGTCERRHVRIVISTLVIDELERIPKKDKKELIFDYLNQIDVEFTI